MTTQTKMQYFPPRSEELEINPEGVIAASVTYESPYTKGEDW